MSPERPAGLEEAHVVRQGYLRRLKTMKRKYFVLKSESHENSARLEYYDSEKKFRARVPPKRAISIKSCFDINRRLDTKHKHVIALHSREEVFCVVLESEEELRAWLNALLALHHGEEGSDELQHPTQHVWLVNVQKKGLGASKNILGLYNLCLTDKIISLWKIKATNNGNTVQESCVQEHLEFSLRNIRRCGDSECFFYMEVGRQTVTGAGELWMHTDDNNIAQSMHTTILRAMTNCSKDNNERDLQPTYRDRSMSANDATKPISMLNRRQTYTGVKTGLSPSNEKGLCSGGMCVASCIKPCVTSSASYCIDRPAQMAAPKSPKAVSINEPSNNTSLVMLSGDRTWCERGSPSEQGGAAGAGAAGEPARKRAVRHHRTVSLPTGCSMFSPPGPAPAPVPPPALAAAAPVDAAPRVAHARTRSLPLAGDDTPNVPNDRAAEHRSPLMVNGAADSQSRARQPAQAWLTRRASTGCRLAKWSPAHPKNGNASVRNRCDSMPSRVCPRVESDTERAPSRVPSQHLEDVGEVVGADEVDGSVEWTPAAHRTPRIPEEPDQAAYCEMNMSAAREPPAPRRIPMKINSTHHSRNSSLAEDGSPPDGYLSMAPGAAGAGGGDTGYVDMHAGRAASPAASGSSVASGTPSTDIRFSEYHLDPISAKILLEDDERPIPRAYSVGSRPTAAPLARTPLADTSRTRAFSVGSKSKMRPLGHTLPPSHVPTPASNKTSSAPLLLLAPRSSADTLCDDLMELDFSNNQQSPRTRPSPVGPSTPPAAGFLVAPHLRTPPAAVFYTPPHAVPHRTPRPNPTKVDEYVDMSPSTPRTSGYVEMRPTERGLTPTSAEQGAPPPATLARSPPSNTALPTPDGYVEMNYGKRPDTTRTPSRPILILSDASRPHGPTSSIGRTYTSDSERSTPSRATPVLSPQTHGRNGSRNTKKMSERQRRNSKDAGTPIGAQTIFPFTLESPASPARPVEGERHELDAKDVFEDDGAHYADVIGTTLFTVREISEEGARRSQELTAGSPPDYVTLKSSAEAVRTVSRPIATRAKLGSEADEPDGALLSSNPTATKTMARESGAAWPTDELRPALVRAASGSGGAARFTPIAARAADVDEPPARKSSSPKPVESALNRALRGEGGPAPTPPPLNYASLDLEPRVAAPPSPTPNARTYTQIDFSLSEKLNTVDSN